MTAVTPTTSATPEPDLSVLPPRVDRKAGAELVTRHFFPIVPRSLEVWPLDWLYVNGKGVCETAQLFAVARAKLAAAVPIRSTRRLTFSAHAASQMVASDPGASADEVTDDCTDTAAP